MHLVELIFFHTKNVFRIRFITIITYVMNFKSTVTIIIK